mmetsp:Transcript_39993/g.119112  ORF Transcript_39993/g.119112 Transcript_39993/m.119112 type:complete len:270 (-) Transcript_39993:351-1160(-)
MCAPRAQHGQQLVALVLCEVPPGRENAAQRVCLPAVHGAEHLEHVVGVAAVRDRWVVGRVRPVAVQDRLVLVPSRQHLARQIKPPLARVPSQIEQRVPADVKPSNLHVCRAAEAVQRDSRRYRRQVQQQVGCCGAYRLNLGTARARAQQLGVRSVHLNSAHPAHVRQSCCGRAPKAGGTVYVHGSANGGVVRARQARHCLGQLSAKIKRVEVAHREAHVAHVAAFLAARANALNVDAKVLQVGILLQAEDGGDVFLCRQAVDVVRRLQA